MAFTYGWIPDKPDSRDRYFSASPETLAALPPAVDLRPHCPPILDQGHLGSCTANAVGSAHQFDQMRQVAESFVPSRLFLYYNTRKLQGTILYDSGASIRDTVKSIAESGVCPELQWPYDTAKFRDAPPAEAYMEALENQAIKYERVEHYLDQIRAVLSMGLPVSFGFSVYESFEAAYTTKTGIVPIPRRTERQLGGHAVLAVGYDDADGRVTFQNSWSDKWGDNGYGYMPYEFIMNQDLAADFWVIHRVEVPEPEPQPEPIPPVPPVPGPTRRMVIEGEFTYREEGGGSASW